MRAVLKRLLRAALGERGYTAATSAWPWGKTLLNYALFRLSRALPVRVRAWPHALYVEGTNVCNAECVFCAYPQMERPKKIMPMELFRRLISEYAELGGGEVDLTPIVGDPFADAKLFERLDVLAAEPRIKSFHFFTNAIAMRPELADRLLGYGPRLTVHVSFGGFDRETYRRVFKVDKFDAVVANLRHMIERKRERGSRMGLQVNLRTPRANNSGEFFAALESCKREGLLELTWMGAYDSWSGKIRTEDLRAVGLEARPEPVRRGPCHRLLTSPVVLADGRVNACACRDVEASLIIGDISDRPLADVLSGRELRELVDAHARGDFPEVCRRCTYYDSIWPNWALGKDARPDPSVPV